MNSSSKENNTSVYKAIYTNYLIPPIAAGLSIILPYYCLVWKSYRQVGATMPPINWGNTIGGGIGAAPIVGGIVGSQMIGMQYIANQISNLGISADNAKAISAVLIAIPSVPALAILNGKTIGLSPLQAVRNITMLQNALIVTRESTFLLSDPIGGMIDKNIKKHCGDNVLASYASTIMGGMIGSMAGHVPDTMITRSQKNLPISKTIKGLSSGMLHKALGVGIFYGLYRATSEGMKQIAQ
jgi:hypothetical protein